MSRWIVLVATTLLLGACGHSHSHEEGAPHSHDATADPRPALSFTDWTDDSELFVELPALVQGQESAFAAHVTKLRPFSALDAGAVTVVLRGPAGEERFESTSSSAPGIFRPVARPASAGSRRLVVEVRGEGFSADHDLGEVTVHESVDAAVQGIPEEAETAGLITFLKEQQWPIEFETAVVSSQLLSPTLRVSGTVRARSDGEVVVTAPASGRVAATNGRSLPRLGEHVEADDVLGSLAPRLEAADLASLELAVTNANLEQRFAERERQRLEALRGEGAVPERRVQDAMHVADEAQAALEAAQRRLAQFRRVERPSPRGASALGLRAPITGTVTAVYVAPGAFVEAGTPLFRITNVSQLWLEARVPEVDVGRLSPTPRGGYFLAEGFEEPFEVPANALVTRGRVVDAATQSLPVIFAIENPDERLPVGAFCRVFLANGEERRAIVVPDSTLVDDGGTTVAFVQVEGEAFERRVVRTGARDRGRVEILGGLREGEHVVTRGAWSVKLAASSGSIPAHGHSH